MSEELTPPAGEDTNEGGPEPTVTDPTIIAKLRDEIKQWKSKHRESEGKLKEAEPVLAKFREQEEAQKTEAQKAAERAQAAEAKAQEAETKAARLEKEKTLLKLATKANVDPDILDMLDLDKFDVTDEKATLAALGKFATARAAGSASNPGRGTAPLTDAEIRADAWGTGRKTTLFGGN